jgi:hypothetical protein
LIARPSESEKEAFARRPEVPALRFTLAEAEAAADEWGFSCGPAALCALLGLAPVDVRPKLDGYRGWMTPTDMMRALGRLRIEALAHAPPGPCAFPSFGVAFIQWGGPWMRPEVPVRARYRHTHWVASWRNALGDATHVFDVNALDVGGWVSKFGWVTEIVPELRPKRGDGTWTISKAIEVRP